MKRILPIFAGFALLATVSCVKETGQKEDEKDKEKTETAVSLSVAELNIAAGESAVLEAVVTPADRAGEVVWESGDSEIASVGGAEISSGTSSVTVTGNAIGKTTVIAVIDNIIERCTVNVLAREATGISLDRTSLSLNVGDTETLTATVEPEDVSYPAVSWSSDNEAVATVSGGEVKAVSAGTAVITAKSGSLSAECTVTVSNIDAVSLTLDITSRELSEGEVLMLTATVAPSDATFKDVEWTTSDDGVVSVEKIDASTADDYVNGRVTALAPGTAVITASCGKLEASCTVTVKAADPPLEDPKIGDYFYSDGTWSDGGLISINDDGTNPVWANPKPAPNPNKTVIGIVFQTNPDRIHSTDIGNGYTHGYVVCTWSAHSPSKNTTYYSFDWDISFMNGIKSGKSYYENLAGYLETHAARAAYEGRIDQIPAIDWTTTDFKIGAPSNTSGWYLPSTGQMWDMFANLCGDDVAKGLLPWRTYSSDITYTTEHLRASYDLVAAFNSTMALVPEDQKEELPYTSKYGNNEYTCELWCSTLYNSTEDGCAAVFEIGTAGYFWIGTQWVDYEAIARPVLSF